MSNIKSGEYPIFDDRYKVVIGVRGKVSLVSNVGCGKEMKLYGRVRDSLRYVNLTTVKGSTPTSYRVSDLVSYATGEVETIVPITEDEIHDILDQVKAPPLLSEPLVIESLPTEEDRYRQTVYVEELETYTRYYTKISFNNTSNGFLKFNYRVSTHCNDSRTTTNSTTEVYTDHSAIIIKDINRLDNTTRNQIIKLLQDTTNNEE